MDCVPKMDCTPTRECTTANVCDQAEDCTPVRDCEVCALGACFDDPACAREKAAARYGCEVRKAGRKIECERLGTPAKTACESERAAEQASCEAQRSDKEACLRSRTARTPETGGNRKLCKTRWNSQRVSRCFRLHQRIRGSSFAGPTGGSGKYRRPGQPSNLASNMFLLILELTLRVNFRGTKGSTSRSDCLSGRLSSMRPWRLKFPGQAQR